MDLQFTVRKSKRAKYPQLKISFAGLEVILPYRFPISAANNLLRNKRDWIDKYLTKFPTPTDINPPQSIYLPALEQHWEIEYIPGTQAACLSQLDDQKLQITGNYQTKEYWRILLKTWIKKQAKAHLPHWLNKISQEHNLSFNRVSIRAQRTRWGSCSAKKNINLNYLLLFMPAHLVRHILLHELCHTVHLNHSKAFWKLLTTLDANAPQYGKQTRHPHLFVPLWI